MQREHGIGLVELAVVCCIVMGVDVWLLDT